MNKIVQHIPAFVDGVDPQSATFSSLDELREVPFVRRFMEAPDFFRLSQDDPYLIAESFEGRHWWVIGRLAQPCDDLPIWRPVYRLRDANGAVADYERDEVLSSCGDEVRMRDGRTLTRVRDHGSSKAPSDE